MVLIVSTGNQTSTPSCEAVDLLSLPWIEQKIDSRVSTTRESHLASVYDLKPK